MNKESKYSDFFVAGGPLPPDSPSYVERPADDQLFNLILRADICYVLTPPQMGKSSLMSRTANRLKKQGISAAIIDLTSIGTVTIDAWYLGLLEGLQENLHLAVDTLAWWEGRAPLGHVQRFTNFLRDVVLTEISGQVVIFIDEIDSTLNLDFRDDFFAAIRAMYNARANDPEFKRLVFVLFGVVSPPDLIKDGARTPFNISEAIPLEEFTKEEAKILQEGLEAISPSQAEAIFDRIYYWTNGYPYLTQKLCLAIAQSEKKNWTNLEIDQLVEQLFFSETANKDSNLQFVQDKTLNHPQRSQLLNIYKKVYQGKKVANDGQSIIQNQLKLSGLLKEEGGYLQTRNRIYRHVFDLAWVEKNTKRSWTPIVAAIVVLFAFLSGYIYISLESQNDDMASLPTATLTLMAITASTEVHTTSTAISITPSTTSLPTKVSVSSATLLPSVTKALPTSTLRSVTPRATKNQSTSTPTVTQRNVTPSATQPPPRTTVTVFPPTPIPTLTPLATLIASPTVFSGYSVGPTAISPRDTTINSDVVRFEWQWNGQVLLPNHSFALVGFRDGQFLRIATVDPTLRSIDVGMITFGGFETRWEWYVVIVDGAGSEVSPRSEMLEFAISLSPAPQPTR